MALHVGTGSGNQEVTDLVVGTSGGNKAVQELWVGTPAGNKLVWQRNTFADVVLSASASAYNQINLSWNDVGDGATYVLKRGSTVIYTGSGTSKADTGLSASTSYSYTIQAKSGTTVLSTDTASATTSARPTQQKTVTLSPSSAGSYTGSGSRRNTGGPYYSGRYSSTQGRQKSSFHFAIPSDVRGCKSVDRVRFKIQNDHSYSNGGVTQFLAITHTQTAGSTWPGSTGHFGGRATAKDAWYGNAPTQWVDITNDRDGTFNDTVANNFRARNAWGICLLPPNDDISYYSYWRAGTAALELTYTVWAD